jgi:hypothetical protein
MQTDIRAHWVLPLAIVALVLWPLSFAWIPAAGHNPAWVLAMVPLAEIAAILLAIAAIWLGTFVARDQHSTRSSDLGVRLGMLVVILVVGSNLFGQAFVR